MSIFKKVSVTIKGPVVDNGVEEREFIFDPNDRKSINIASDHIWAYMRAATYGCEDIAISEIEGLMLTALTSAVEIETVLDEATMSFRQVEEN